MAIQPLVFEEPALEVAGPRRPVDGGGQPPPYLWPLLFLLLSLFPALPCFPGNIAPVCRPCRYLAGFVARLGLLHVLPCWCCVGDAEGRAVLSVLVSSAASALRLFGAPSALLVPFPLPCLDGCPSGWLVRGSGASAHPSPLLRPSGVWYRGAATPAAPPLALLRWHSCGGGYFLEQVVLCPGYMYFWCRRLGRLRSPRLSHCAPSALCLHRMAHQHRRPPVHARAGGEQGEPSRRKKK